MCHGEVIVNEIKYLKESRNKCARTKLFEVTVNN